ncbi:MAG: hypothetical protein ACFB6R_11835 [Alphaproteobacteria bacterium]
MTVLPDTGAGILSWKGYGSLRGALESYRAADFLSLFPETRIFLPEAEDEGRHMAAEFGLSVAEHPDNLGILGGFEGLARSMSSRYVLLLENDFKLVEDRDTAARELATALDLLRTGRCQVIRLRSRRQPGPPLTGLQKYRRLYPVEGDGPWQRAAKGALRMIRPDKARRNLAACVYLYEDPSMVHPDVIRRDPDTGFFLVSSRFMNWTNQAFLIERQFFLDRIIGYAKTHATRRGINNFRSLEIEMNSPYWRRSGWHVGLGDGLFTHARRDDRGY